MGYRPGEEFHMPAINSAEARDATYHLHPYTNLRQLERDGPLAIDRGEGVFVIDTQGNRYLEGMAGLWCTSLGFSEPRLAEAAYRQLKTLPFYHSFAAKVASITTELAERLIGIAPEPLARVIFACSGSESNDTAIKMVWYYNNARGMPAKKKIISRRRGYHGVTALTASLTGLPYAQNGFDLPLGVGIFHLDAPHFYRGGLPGESEEDFATRLAAQLEDLILAEGADTIGAMIAEPVMGAGGVILPPATYFEKIQAVLRRYDILLIADEVICGFGRTGSMFGCETFGIRPDMMVVAKALSSGYQPISALMVSDAIYQVVADAGATLGLFGHGYTYSGHPVPAAVALETLKIYEERDIAARVRDVAPHFQARIRRLGQHPLVGEARGIGLIGAIELVADKHSRQSYPASAAIAPYVVKQSQAHGLIIRSVPGDIVVFSPPLVITEAEIDIMFDAVTRALDDTLAHVHTLHLGA